MTLVFNKNSEEIRKKIEDAGIKLCQCASFVDACWLDYNHGVTDSVHGVGYPYENESQAEALARFLYEIKEAHVYSDVEKFIKAVKAVQAFENGYLPDDITKS
jgi:hypothetical protein